MELAGGLGVVAGNAAVQAGTNFSKMSGSDGGSGKQIPKDGSKMSTDKALNAADDFLGVDYKDMGNGRFVSADGKRQVRMGNSDLSPTNNHAGAPHMNFETLKPNPTRPGKMQITNKIHVFLTD